MLTREKHNRSRKLAAIVALTAMGVLGAAPALAAISFGAPVVPNPELAKLRGGFNVGGMKFNFAFVSATCVNGSCMDANFNSNNLPTHATQLQQVIQVQQASNGVQAQINGQTMDVNTPQQASSTQVLNTNISHQINPQQLNPQQAVVTNVIPNSVRQSMPALTSIVQNTANNAVIQHISSLTMTVENATAVHQMMAAGQILQQSSIRSLPIP
jgi:hypothetical protein